MAENACILITPEKAGHFGDFWPLLAASICFMATFGLLKPPSPTIGHFLLLLLTWTLLDPSAMPEVPKVSKSRKKVGKNGQS